MVKSPTYWTHQGKCIFKGSVSRDLCKNTLACLSEAQMGSNHEKIEVKISCHTSFTRKKKILKHTVLHQKL